MTVFNLGTGRASTLKVQSAAIPVSMGQPALEPIRLSGHEGMNRLFEYELLLQTPDALNLVASEAADFDLDAFIGLDISCSIDLDGSGEFRPGTVGRSMDHIGAGTRQINALITKAVMLGEEGRHIQYALTLRPWLHLTTLSTNSKIYQNKTVVQILDEMLADYSYPVHKILYDTYPVRDYQTQFNETNFEFFERLCQEWGISYHFEHSEGKHRLVLSDAMGAYAKNPSEAYHEVEYHAPGWKVDAEYVHSFMPENRLTSGRYATRDYDYTRPRADLSASRRDPRPTGQADSEVYQWHADAGGSHYAQPKAGTAEANDPREEGSHLALLRMEALRTHGARAQGRGNLRGMVPGCTFRLQRHPRDKANAEYLILDTHFLIQDVAQNSQSQNAEPGHKAGWRVEVEFTAHPVKEPLRPALTQPKPRPGPQTARVVGPAGQNIWTDSLGRIKVQFPWDRMGENDQRSSCWVRVSSPWAGNQLGAMHLPRIGQEVLIEYVNNDADLPVCTARLHNQVNMPPWSLPDQAALSGYRSRELTHEGGNSAMGRSNHLILDDTIGEIQVQAKCDHQSSSLSLGRIVRIDDNAGRKDARGEGLELRTDGHAAFRSMMGTLITTYGRERAQAHVKDMGEAVHRFTQARDQHETLASLAQQHDVQDAKKDQETVSEQLKALNDEIKGGTAGPGEFPELTRPHLVLASAAAIAATAADNLHLASGAHLAATSGGHTSVSSGKSLLASAMDAIRLFAYNTGIRIFAAKGAVQVQAQDDMIELVAKKAIELISSTDWIRLKAKKGISFEAAESAFQIDAKGFQFFTPAAHHVWAGDHQTFGPKSLTPLLPELPTSVCIPCLLKAARSGSAIAKI